MYPHACLIHSVGIWMDIKAVFILTQTAFFHKDCIYTWQSPGQSESLCKLLEYLSIYTSACDSMGSAEYEKALSIGVCKPVLRATLLCPRTPLPSLPFCFFLSLWIRLRLGLMGSPKAPPSPRPPLWFWVGTGLGNWSLWAPPGTSNSGLNRITTKKTAAWPPQTGREKGRKKKRPCCC